MSDRSLATRVAVTMAGAVLVALAAVAPADAARPGRVITFEHATGLVTRADADTALEAAPASFRAFVPAHVGQLRSRDKKAMGARAFRTAAKQCRKAGVSAVSLSVVAVHTRGFALGGVADCVAALGYDVVWKRAGHHWKPVVYIQGAPRCSELRKAKVPVSLWKVTGMQCATPEGYVDYERGSRVPTADTSSGDL